MNLNNFHSELTSLLVSTSQTKASLIEAKNLSGDAEIKYRLACYDYINRMFSVFESTHGPVKESHQVLIRLIGDDISSTVMSGISQLESMQERLKDTPSEKSIATQFKILGENKIIQEKYFAGHLNKINWINVNLNNIQILSDLEATQIEIDSVAPGIINRMFNGRNQKVFTASSTLNIAWIDDLSPFKNDENKGFNLEAVEGLMNNNVDVTSEHNANMAQYEEELRSLAKSLQLERELKSKAAFLQNDKTIIRMKILEFVYKLSSHECIETLLGKDIALQYIKARGHSRAIESHSAFFDSALTEINDCQLKIKDILYSLDLCYGELEHLETSSSLVNKVAKAKEELVNLREAAKKYIDALWFIKTNNLSLEGDFTVKNVFDLLMSNLNELGHDFDISNFRIYDELPDRNDIVERKLSKFHPFKDITETKIEDEETV